MNATSSIIDWVWLTYKVKIQETEALEILLNFTLRVEENTDWLDNLHKCMRESIKECLMVQDPDFDPALN
jgi:hypothetical protein